MKVFLHPDVADVRNLHARVFNQNGNMDVFAFLVALSENLFQEIRRSNLSATAELRNFHPSYIGLSPSKVIEKKPSLADCQLAILREFGFNDFSDIPNALSADPAFEHAVDLMLTGDFHTFKNKIEEQPELVSCRSAFGHKATILHYASTNGVEIYRQAVPQNLPERVELLKKHGADLQATARFYGQQLTPIELANTSAHPEAAGIKDALIKVLSN